MQTKKPVPLKTLKIILSALLLISLLNSCEKKLTVTQGGGADEVSDYVIVGDELTLSDNGADAVTYTKVN